MVELAPSGGDGAAGPATGGVSALGVGADIGGRGIRVCLVGVKPADEGVICRGVVEVYPSGTGVKDQVGIGVGGKRVDCNTGVGVFENEVDESLCEVPRVLFLGICLDFYFYLRRVLLPKFGFDLDWGSVSQALVEPRLVPP